MNIVTRFGDWIERHWPEQMTTEEVKNIFDSHDLLLKIHTEKLDIISKLVQELRERHIEQNDQLSKLTQEMNLLKNQVTVRSRIMAANPDTMTPFASRLTPVKPNGGNQSPQ